MVEDPQWEPWTPRQVEEKLAELMNAVAQSELGMRRYLEQEADATLAYERAHVIAATDPNCPIPSRAAGGATVGERESWIRGMCEAEYQGLEYSKLNVTIARNYQRRLETQVSIVQTMAKLVIQAYDVVGARGTGGV